MSGFSPIWIHLTDVRWKKQLDRDVLKLIRKTCVDDKIDIIHTGNSRTTLHPFGIPDDAMVVTVASRLRPRKGLVELVRALGLIDASKNIHVPMLGHEGNDEIRAVVSALPHAERVHRGGYCTDAPNIMAASDACCLPVLWGEGLSRMVIGGTWN
jgi:glycosyltransferase involved in cell wall biosynthesis